MKKEIKNTLEGICLALVLSGIVVSARVELGSWSKVYDAVKTVSEISSTPIFYYNNIYK